MRRLSLLTLALIALSTAALTAAGSEAQVVAAEKTWAKAVTANDLKTVDDVLHDKLIYAHSTGVTESKAEYMGKLKAGTQVYDVIDHEKTTVRAFGSAAAAHSIVVMKGNTKGVPFNNRLMMMHLWILEDGQWKLAAHQTTKLTQ